MVFKRKKKNEYDEVNFESDMDDGEDYEDEELPPIPKKKVKKKVVKEEVEDDESDQEESEDETEEEKPQVKKIKSRFEMKQIPIQSDIAWVDSKTGKQYNIYQAIDFILNNFIE